MAKEQALCGYPNCDCPEPKLHEGAIQIATRLVRNPKRRRMVYDRKGLPTFKMGSTYYMRECKANAWIEAQESKK